MTNTRQLVSRNKREGFFWHGFDEHNRFKMRMKSDDVCSLKAYGIWLKNQNKGQYHE